MTAAAELPAIVFWRSAEWVSIAPGESPAAFAASATERRIAESGKHVGKRQRQALEQTLEAMGAALLGTPGTHGGFFWLPDPPHAPQLYLRLIGIEGADVEGGVDGARKLAGFPEDWYVEPPDERRIDTALGPAIRTVHRVANQDFGGKISDTVSVLWWFDGLGGWMLRTQVNDTQQTATYLPAIDQLVAGAELQQP